MSTPGAGSSGAGRRGGGDFDALLARGDISATDGDPERASAIVVDAPEVDLSGGIVVLEGGFVDVAARHRRRPARRPPRAARR